MIYIGELYNLCKVRYVQEIIGVMMIAYIIKQSLEKWKVKHPSKFWDGKHFFKKVQRPKWPHCRDPSI